MGPHWGLALASLPILGGHMIGFQWSLQVLKHPGRSEVPGQGPSTVLSHLRGPHVPGLAPAAPEFGNLQEGDWAYNVEIFQRHV